MTWIDDLRAQYLREQAEGYDNGGPVEDDRDSGDREADPERCPVCGGFYGDYGTCVTVGCEGAE